MSFLENLQKIENRANHATLHGELRQAFGEVTKVIAELKDQLEYAEALRLKLASKASVMLALPPQDIGMDHHIAIPAEPARVVSAA